MPLAFGAILGGTMTLVGTPPNILAGAILRDQGMETFNLFDFTPVGGLLLLVGIVLIWIYGYRISENPLPRPGIFFFRSISRWPQRYAPA